MPLSNYSLNSNAGHRCEFKGKPPSTPTPFRRYLRKGGSKRGFAHLSPFLLSPNLMITIAGWLGRGFVSPFNIFIPPTPFGECL